ncbi:MAG: hypothetical protein MUP21_08050 [Dehalococcoidia bacterium]|nr:hypothetical protein [Dehalococcoidia bacterium]
MKKRRKSHASTAKARIDQVFDKLALEEDIRNPKLAVELGMKRLGYYEEYKMYKTRELTAEEAALDEKRLIVLKQIDKIFTENPDLIFHPASVELFESIGMEHPLAPYFPHLSRSGGYLRYKRSILLKQIQEMREKIGDGELNVDGIIETLKKCFRQL